MQRTLELIGLVALCSTVFLVTSRGIAGDDALSSATVPAKDAFTRPEEDPAWLRRFGTAISVRISGEFRRQQQITIYQAESLTSAILLVEAEAEPRKKEPNATENTIVQELQFTSVECPALVNVAARLQKARFTLEVSRAIHAPSVVYQLWSTSPMESRYLRFHRPEKTASSVASWGNSLGEDSELLEIVDELFQVAARCAQQRQK